MNHLAAGILSATTAPYRASLLSAAPGTERRGSGTRQSHGAHGTAAASAAWPAGDVRWPPGTLCELLFDADGRDALDLLLPTLAALTAQRRHVVVVSPPHWPSAPALRARGLDPAYLTLRHSGRSGDWSAEQCLRSGACAAVLLWEDAATDYAQLRRWQRAAESGGALAFLLRPARAADQPSPAALRLQLRDLAGPHAIEVLRSRGRFHGGAAAPPRRGD